MYQIHITTKFVIFDESYVGVKNDATWQKAELPRFQHTITHLSTFYGIV